MGERKDRSGVLTGLRTRLFGDGGLRAALFTSKRGGRWLDSRLPRWACVTLRTLGWLSMPLFPLFCLFLMDYMNFRKLDKYLNFLENFPGSAKFECLVVLVLFLLLVLLFRRGAAAAGVMGAVSLAFGYINYMKVSLNGDYFHPRDFSMVDQAGDLMSFISGAVPRWFFIAGAVIVLWVVYLAVTGVDLPVRWTIRWPVLGLALAMMLPTFSDMDRSNMFLGKFGMTFFDAALQSSNYNANGFVGAFTLNVLMTADLEEPEDYTEDTVSRLMEGAEGVEQTGPDYDVIVVLSESFFDARTLPGVSFSRNPLPRYDELLAREGVYSGYIYTTASGGGTVRPEFELLTGLSTDYLHDVATPYELVDGDVESYVSNYRDAGYRTVAIHPYNKKFYRRAEAYPFIGFDEFLGMDEVPEIVEAEYKRGLISDDTTLRAIEYELERAEADGVPIFLEAITMQNHQPFNKLPDEDIRIGVSSDILTESTLDAVTTYTQGLADADRMLGDLVDYIDGRERPTLLIFYGDHIPTIGDAYYETGLFGGEDKDAEVRYRYSTPFILYTNTHAVSGLLDSHTDIKISPYYLLEVGAEMTGFRQTPFMGLLARYHGLVPYYNVRLTFLQETEDTRALAHMHEYITYDRLVGERWSVTGRD